MKKFLTEFDELQDALSRVRIDENVMPYYNGRLVENEASYNKIQKLLKCNEMESAHRYLYDLDVENLDDDDISKIDKLFDMGVRKGYIDNSFQEEFDKEENPDAFVPDEEVSPGFENTAVQQFGGASNVKVPCWTVLYSATKNGETKCGECYSNAISVSAAKSDCIAKLSRFGYDNISILATEAGTSCGSSNCDCQACDEDDLLDATPHNGKALHNGHSEDLSEAGNPYIKGMKTAKFSNLLEDDEEGSDDTGDEGSDDEGSDDEGSDDEGSDDEGSDDEGSDDDGEDSDDDEGSDDEDDEDSDEDSDDGDDDGEDLDDETKANLKNEYRKIFRQVMINSFDGKSFDSLTLDEKIKFLESFRKEWKKNGYKNERNDFMSDEECNQIDAMTMSSK